MAASLDSSRPCKWKNLKKNSGRNYHDGGPATVTLRMRLPPPSAPVPDTAQPILQPNNIVVDQHQGVLAPQALPNIRNQDVNFQAQGVGAAVGPTGVDSSAPVPPTVPNTGAVEGAVPFVSSKVEPLPSEGAATTNKETLKQSTDSSQTPKPRRQSFPVWIVQFVLLLETVVSIAATAFTLSYCFHWWTYSSLIQWSLLSTILSAPGFLAVALLCSIAHNWTITKVACMNKLDRHASFTRSVIASKITLLAVSAAFGSLYATQKFDIPLLLKPSLNYMIQNAYYDEMELGDIHMLQADFKCCGVSVETDIGNDLIIPRTHPWFSWFQSHVLDNTYPSSIRALYTLPSSCCSSAVKDCQHFGVSRFLRNFSTEAEYYVEEQIYDNIQWNPSLYENRENRTAQAMATVYQEDCSTALAVSWRDTNVKLAIGIAVYGASCLLSIIALTVMLIMLPTVKKKQKEVIRKENVTKEDTHTEKLLSAQPT